MNNVNKHSLQKAKSLDDLATRICGFGYYAHHNDDREHPIPKEAVKEYLEVGAAFQMKEIGGANGFESKKMTIKAYREEVVVEVVYPSCDAGYFEKELLQTIVLNAYTRITRALDDDDERDRKDVEELLLDRWMSILGSFYRDYANHVELSKYEQQSQTVYKVAFKSRFLYD